MHPKFLFIMRGLPGSGRTSTAIEIAGDDGLIIASPPMGDSLDIAIESGHQKVILDGEHIKLASMQVYIDKGLENEYTIVMAYPGSEDAWDIKECSRKSGISHDILQKMLDEFEHDTGEQE